MNEQADRNHDEPSQRFLEMVCRTGRHKRVRRPDAYGKRTGACGDTIEFFLILHGGCLSRIFFDTDGCMNTIACANTVSFLNEGKTVAEAWELKAEDIIDYLETLPPDQHHCAELAVGAFYLALADHSEFRRSPWKKAYRNQ